MEKRILNTKLNLDILLAAYCQGYFPMPDPKTGEIRWYRPDPRAIIPLENFHISKSLARVMKKSEFTWTLNKDFSQVIHACANRDETWINEEFIEKYCALHKLGFAHSIEVWQGSRLAGGVYGVCLGGAFFAESMFHRVTNASKVALTHLVEELRAKGMQLLEVQFLTSHLASLGAIEVSDAEYQILLQRALKHRIRFS